MDANGYVFQDRRRFEGIENAGIPSKGGKKVHEKTEKEHVKKPLPILSPEERKLIDSTLLQCSNTYKKLPARLISDRLKTGGEGKSREGGI